MKGCPIVQLAIKAGLALLTSTLSRAIPPGCMGVLDLCLRAARQSHMDRLGPVHTIRHPVQVEQAACFAMLIYYDWRAAPFQGCYTVYPGTFTTTWDQVTLATIQESFPLDEWIAPFGIWKWHMRAAQASRVLCELGLHDAAQRAQVQ